MRLTSSSPYILVLITISMSSRCIKKLLMVLSWITKLGLWSWCMLMHLILRLVIVHHMLERVNTKMTLICSCAIVLLHCVHHSIVLRIWLSTHWIIFHTCAEGWIIDKTLLRTKEIHLLNGIDILLIMLVLILVHAIHI
jgi:hypothetical protein